MAWEDDLATTERALGKVCMECDAKCNRAEAVQQDYRAKMCATTTSSWRSLDFDQVLRGCQFILTVWGTDLERREEKLAEEQAWGLYSFDVRNRSVELEELHEHVAGGENECVVEDVQLSRSVMEISNALVDLGVFPTRDIPAQPRSA
jgi:hypothetical protein